MGDGRAAVSIEVAPAGSADAAMAVDAAGVVQVSPASLKILHILRAPLGGLFRHVVDVAQGQAERGHRVGLIVDSTDRRRAGRRRRSPRSRRACARHRARGRSRANSVRATVCALRRISRRIGALDARRAARPRRQGRGAWRG